VVTLAWLLVRSIAEPAMTGTLATTAIAGACRARAAWTNGPLASGTVVYRATDWV